MICYPT